MLKTIQKHVVLWVQSKTGVTLVFLVAMTFASTAILMTFFFCVSQHTRGHPSSWGLFSAASLRPGFSC